MNYADIWNKSQEVHNSLFSKLALSDSSDFLSNMASDFWFFILGHHQYYQLNLILVSVQHQPHLLTLSHISSVTYWPVFSKVN